VLGLVRVLNYFSSQPPAAAAFLAQVAFTLKRLPSGPPEIFRIFGGCGTRAFASRQKRSDILAVPVLSLRQKG